AGGGAYTIGRLADGDYDVVAAGPTYLSQTEYGITVSGGGETTGIDFTLQRVTGRIEGEVAITGGPDVDVTVGVYDPVTGEVGGEGEVVIEDGTGSFSIGTIVDGNWLVLAQAKGYVEADTLVTVAGGDTTDVGLLELTSVVATKYGFTDAMGNNIYGSGTTVSLPGAGIYYYARAWIEPRDDDGRIAYWDVPSQENVVLYASKLDPSYPTAGNIIFADPAEIPLPDATLTAAMFDDGRAPFLVSGDAVEVVRVLAEKLQIQGVLDVGIAPPAPVRLAFSADATTIAAGEGVARITGQLVDASGNDAQVSGVIANLIPGGVGGDFSISSPETESNGRFEVDFSGAAAGTAYVSATIDPSSPYPSLAVDTLMIVLTPGDAAFIEMSPAPRALRPGDSATITAQVVDAWGNAVATSGLSIALAASPPQLLVSIDSPLVTGATGQATGQMVAGSNYGTVEVSGTATGIQVETFYIPIDATIVAVDEVAPESDAAHNSDAGVDLTVLHAANDSDELMAWLDFDSSWDGVHLILLVEANNDAVGGVSDPFGFAVTYEHALKPEYAFTYKYSGEDYADLRRNLGSVWEHYDFVEEAWRDGWAPGVNGVEQGKILKEAGKVSFKLPLSVIEAAVGDTVRIQAYLTQEADGEQRAALDSSPGDATHDMTPETGEWWETATTPVALVNYVEYVVREEGLAPALSEGQATPSPATPGQLVTYSVRVVDTGGGIGDVFLDLTAVGGSDFLRMSDDGADADASARDGVYTATEELSTAASHGEHTVTVTARDAENVATVTLGMVIDANNPATAIRQFDDPEGDDHGPNGGSDHPGEQIEGLYYKYPTNLVFPQGAFDITGFEIFADGNKIVFRTHIKNLVYHQDPSAAD
ncbi:MAG: glucodextranase DOMON-like domain-containing protein, partial [Candidatus Eisenbacteria bacterium]